MTSLLSGPTDSLCFARGVTHEAAGVQDGAGVVQGSEERALYGGAQGSTEALMRMARKSLKSVGRQVERVPSVSDLPQEVLF